MFASLSDRLRHTFQALSGKGRLREEHVKAALGELRKVLLEADVALSVVDRFLALIKDRAPGQAIISELNPTQALVKIVNDELIRLMGGEKSDLNLVTRPPAVILMAGLQGVGKTTTVGKLCHYLMHRANKRVMVASADVYRPGAIEQLQVLAASAGAGFFPSTALQRPVDIARAAKLAAEKQFQDVLIIDTAGRSTIDAEMMAEISALHSAINPIETLFVVDAMTGQDAAVTAKAFGEALPLTGIILAKMDGDSRGGAALSVRELTGCPVKFMGTGEKLEEFELFHPDRVASRILGMGDILTLIEEVEAKSDKKKSEQFARKIKRGQKFDFYDFRKQLQQVNAMGGMGALMAKLPGMTAQATSMIDDSALGSNNKRMEAMINSMTPQERRRPELIIGARKRRIARGSGTEIQDVNRLLKQHKAMQKMAKKMKGAAGMKKIQTQLGSLSKMQRVTHGPAKR